MEMQAKFEQSHERPKEAGLSGEPAEELRVLVLLRIHEIVGADGTVEVIGARLASDLEMSLELAFAAVEYLSRKGYLKYHGAGPRVSITPLGLEYLRSAQPMRMGPPT